MRRTANLVPPGVWVLLVEDEPLIAIDGADMLRAMGVADVVSAHSVAAGLHVLARQEVQAALLDVYLGSDFSFPLARRRASLGVPFGFLTGLQNDPLLEEFKERPVLAKPFTSEQLGDLLTILLGQRQQGGCCRCLAMRSCERAVTMKA
jgi:CheY-like chemotaxis protein